VTKKKGGLGVAGALDTHKSGKTEERDFRKKKKKSLTKDRKNHNLDQKDSKPRREPLWDKYKK